MEASNIKAIREALNDARLAILHLIMAKQACYEHVSFLKTAVDKAESALAAPPRNCDIGTPDEQYARFISFCKPRKCCDCPFGVHNFTKFESCGLAWAQMPYESEEGVSNVV